MKPDPRPRTLQQVAEASEKLEDFGLLLRDWNHVLLREDVSNRRKLSQSLIERPPKRGGVFEQGEVCDAYLGAYAEWICGQAGIACPDWTRESFRYLRRPWFADNARTSLLVLAPSVFRNHGVYTIPENVVRLRRGRPSVDPEQKRRKARERDRRYRQRIKNLVAKARSAGL
jgi:hypothetical protein